MIKTIGGEKMRTSNEVQCYIWWKRVSSRKWVTRTKRGKEIVRRIVAKKYPWYFTIHSQHFYGYTRKGTKLKLKQPCMCKYCGMHNRMIKN